MSALETLRVALRSSDPGAPAAPPRDTCSSDYAIWRFLTAWQQSQTLGADHAVLLRQIARWNRGELHIGAVPPELTSPLAKAGAHVTEIGTLVATPFAPAWLTETSIDASVGIDSAPQRRRLAEETPEPPTTGEPYLRPLGFDRWQSQAQKEAVWTALTAPPRSSSLVALPTGAGKSLCFQMLTRFSDGLTLVVVPTVALAIDHWLSARSVLSNFEGINPEYFASDDPSRDPNEVIDRVRQRRCRLLFTSPESCVSGRFRDVLRESATDGWLENLVIDEAHLVDTWGVYFRVDFQLLSALRRQWLSQASSRVRTLLLSATFTPECRTVLRRLFADASTEWREFLSQRLRPEMTYYIEQFDDRSARDTAAIEAAWKLPRPAIMYTTRREDAIALAQRLRDEGFERLGCFHGTTPGTDRRRLLAEWRDNRIDLMVATSAFGLGVDKQDVRAVTHCCFPEDLHRYYQEVGRGGRDGASAVCLLLPTDGDIALARGMAPRLLRPETLQERWDALWATNELVPGAPNTYRLRLDARPARLRGTRTGRRHVSWNKRLILQLVRAGKLELTDVQLHKSTNRPSPIPLSEELDEATSDDIAADAAEQEYIEPAPEFGADSQQELSEIAVVRLRFTPNTTTLAALIKEVRDLELRTMGRGMDLMVEYVAGNECVSHALSSLYGVTTARSCGGCPACRRRARKPFCPPLAVPILGNTSASQIVVADVPSPASASSQRAFTTLLRRIIRGRGIHRYVCTMKDATLLSRVFGDIVDPSQSIAYRLDVLDGAVPFLVNPDEAVAVLHIGEISEAGLRCRRGRVVYHLVMSDTQYLDRDERWPLESDGARLYPTPELWLQERGDVH